MLKKKFIPLFLTCISLFAVALSGCAKEDKITADDLVDAYLETSADVDYSAKMITVAELLYQGEFEGGTSKKRIEYRETSDADSGITYQEGTSVTVLDFPELETTEEISEIKRYIAADEDGYNKYAEWDAQMNDWFVFWEQENSIEVNEEALRSEAEMSEEDAYYVLTVICKPEDVGFDVTSFIMGGASDVTIECDAMLTAKIAKDTMKCMEFSLELDVLDINTALQEMGAELMYTKLSLSTQEFSFDAVEVELPEGV